MYQLQQKYLITINNFYDWSLFKYLRYYLLINLGVVHDKVYRK